MVFRDNRHSCPRCGSALEETITRLRLRFERCGQCKGNWIELITLRDMFERMKPGAGMPAMLIRVDDDPVLPCPTCGKPMAKRRLHQLDLDRCDHHGVWFDGSELEETLYRYALPDG